MTPQLETGFSIFASWQTALLCLGIYVITYAIRLSVETSWKEASKSIVWNELVLHLSPIFVGALLALLAENFPWPELLKESLSGRMIYGAVCGMASGFVYGRFRAWVSVVTEQPAP